MSCSDREAVHLEKHTLNHPRCLLFDILSKGLNNNQTVWQLLWAMNSTGFENDLEKKNGKKPSVLNPFRGSTPHLLRSEWG